METIFPSHSIDGLIFLHVELKKRQTAFTHTLLVYPSPTCVSCTPPLNASHVALPYMLLMYPSPTCVSCSPPLHVSHVALPYMRLM